MWFLYCLVGLSIRMLVTILVSCKFVVSLRPVGRTMTNRSRFYLQSGSGLPFRPSPARDLPLVKGKGMRQRKCWVMKYYSFRCNKTIDT